MWVAYAAGNKVTLTDDEMISGNGEAEEQYVSNTNIYKITADAVKNGYKGGACAKVKGLICSGSDEYKEAIELFNAALEAKREFVKYEASEITDPEISHTSSTVGGNVSFNVITEIPETFQEKMVDCTKEEILNKNSGCKVYAILKDKTSISVYFACSFCIH